MIAKLKRMLIGERMATKAIVHEKLSNAEGLAILGVDSVSSTAYATEEILRALIPAGIAAFYLSVPMAIVITVLIFLVSFSYQQVVHAYPQGGGVYNVAKKNLGEFPALLGGSSLLIDYILTVAVSIAAGVAAITSAFPALHQHRIAIGIGIIVLLTWMNLRGVRESGKIFALPVYLFIASCAALIGYGLIAFFTGPLPLLPAAKSAHSGGEILSALIILRAFASGCTAMTGIEATSNGVPLFKQPESENAAKTLFRMAVILGTIFAGITFLAYQLGVTPSEHETVISQMAHALMGNSILYYVFQGSTMIILLLAANTSFAGFPRVASQLAEDGYMPHQFLNLGSRLVFANGILALSGLAATLLYIFNGSVHALIPLYAVGVFLGFSLSQLGMIIHWQRNKGNTGKMLITFIGFAATVAVFAIVFATKFFHGAWVLVPAIAGIIMLMKKIKRHYTDVANFLSLERNSLPRVEPNRTMVVLVSEVNRAALYAVHFAKIFQPAHLRAVHIAVNQEETEEIRAKWTSHVPDVPLDVLTSEDRDLFTPIITYLKAIDGMWSDDSVIAVIPEFIPENFLHNILHNQTALRLRYIIESDPELNVETLNVPVKANTPFTGQTPIEKAA
ncbi:MAG: APC family permease [Candidatus Sungbacteria bacterium]|nr:APC family permease [Candidatus Sungbacteria bacterium]